MFVEAHSAPSQRRFRYPVPLHVLGLAIALFFSTLVAAEAHEFVSFEEFLEGTASATLDEYSGLQDTRVSDARAFEEMKAHIANLYNGVEAANTFFLDGKHVDCIPIHQQPGLRRGDQKLAPIPTASVRDPHTLAYSASRTGELIPPTLREGKLDEHGDEMFCGEGHIPMLRVNLERMSRFESLDDFLSKNPRPRGGAKSMESVTENHYYAIGTQAWNNYGGGSYLNLWKPVVASGEMSLSQQWYSAGSGSGLQTVEGGWQVYPDLYGSTSPSLFVFWTPDDYSTKCYNLDCPAFVQTDSSWVLGGALGPISTTNGAQYEIYMKWEKFPTGWWLALAGSQSERWIGYYPTGLYGSGPLASKATDLEFGGETTGTPSALQMGSGAFAGYGWKKSAYQRNIYMYTSGGSGSTNGSWAWASLAAIQPNPSCYNIYVTNALFGGTWKTHLYFGGPSCN